jgi:hypothetical protein
MDHFAGCQKLRYPWLLSCSEHRVTARYHSNLHRSTFGTRRARGRARRKPPSIRPGTRGRPRTAGIDSGGGSRAALPSTGNVNMVLERSTDTTFPPWLIFCGCLLVSCQPVSSSSSLAVAKQSSPVAARSTNRTEPLPQASSPAVEIRNGPIAGSIELATRATVELAPELIVEKQLADGSFQPLRNLDLGTMKLVTSCDQKISGCVKVGERGFRPVPWSGMSCSSQCNHSCDKNVRLYGRFRFVVRSCDGKTRFEGPVFELLKTY